MKKNTDNTELNFDDLLVEFQEYIRTFLSPRDLLQLTLVNKNQSSLNAYYWKTKFKEYFSFLLDDINCDKNTNWQEEFKKAFINEYNKMPNNSKRLFCLIVLDQIKLETIWRKETPLENIIELDFEPYNPYLLQNFYLIEYLNLSKQQRHLDAIYQLALQQFLKENWFHFAVLCNQSEQILNDLLASGYNINSKMETTYECIPIHYAVKFGNLSMVKYLLEKGASASWCTHLPSQTYNLVHCINPLTLAMLSGHDDIVTWLLEKNLTIRFASRDYFNEVAELGHINIIFSCLKRLAEQNNNYKASHYVLFEMLVSANKNKHFEETFKHMQECYPAFTSNIPPIILSILSGDIDKIIGNPYISEDYQPIFGTPLMCASKCHDLQAVNLLFQHGVNVNQPSRYETPLHFAIRYSTLEIVQTFINNDANVYAKTDSRPFPSKLANFYGKKDIEKTLLCEEEIQKAIKLLETMLNTRAILSYPWDKVNNTIDYLSYNNCTFPFFTAITPESILRKSQNYDPVFFRKRLKTLLDRTLSHLSDNVITKLKSLLIIKELNQLMNNRLGESSLIGSRRNEEYADPNQETVKYKK